MKKTLIFGALLLALGAKSEEFPKKLKLNEEANAEMQKFLGSYSVTAYSAKENGLPVEAKEFKLVKVELAKSRNAKLPTEGSYDLDLYVALDAHSRFEMWNFDATQGDDDGLAREGVLIRLEKIKGHPAWKKVSYSSVGGEQIIMTDIFSFEKTEETLLYKQKRTVFSFALNQTGKMGKIAPARRRSSEYVYTLKKL